MIRVQSRRTTDRSWLMKASVSPRSRTSPSSRFSTCACEETSSPETISSARMKSGRSSAIARAMPTRCRCPPDKLVREAGGEAARQAHHIERLVDARARVGDARACGAGRR
jgi:hypothetical protein